MAELSLVPDTGSKSGACEPAEEKPERRHDSPLTQYLNILRERLRFVLARDIREESH
jgi:hypothetical protein